MQPAAVVVCRKESSPTHDSQPPKLNTRGTHLQINHVNETSQNRAPSVHSREHHAHAGAKYWHMPVHRILTAAAAGCASHLEHGRGKNLVRTNARPAGPGAMVLAFLHRNVVALLLVSSELLY